MDDDLTFGTSVWATSEAVTADNSLLQPTNNPHSVVGVFTLPKSTFDDDFSDFGPSADAQDIPTDDDFGDFGGFGEVIELDDAPATSLAQADDFRIAGSSSHSWRPLSLNPIPSQSGLESMINETLSPIWSHEDITDVTTDDPIREVEGLAQILTTPSRCAENRILSSLSAHFPPVVGCTKTYCKRHHRPNLQTGRALVFVSNTLLHSVFP
jgi:hypothetical protein